MNKDEWILRCQRQFARRTNDWSYDWRPNADVCYEENIAGFEDDPEGAADEEMSYWD